MKCKQRLRKVDPQQLQIENWLELCFSKTGKKYKISKEELLKQLEKENSNP